MALNRSTYRSILMKIDSELHIDDLESLKFLCLPFLPRGKVLRVNSGHELFELLETNGNICENDSTLLLKLLDVIGRRDLYDFTVDKVQVDSVKSGSPIGLNLFYETLYKISEELGPDDVTRLRYLLCCAKNKVIISGIQLFSALLERNEIGPSKLDTLCASFNDIGRQDLIDMLTDFKDAFSKQEPNFLYSSPKYPVMVSEEMCSPSEEENLKRTNYYSDNLLERVDALHVSSNQDSGFADKGKNPHLMFSSGNSSDTYEAKGNNSEKITSYFNQIQSGDDEMLHENQPMPLLPRYRMDAIPRGVCLVIDNEVFTFDRNDSKAKDLKNRKGSDKDTENIRNCFTKLNFVVEVCRDLTDTDILQRFQVCSTNINANKRHNCFITFILSHGGMDKGTAYVYGSNCRKVYLNDITNMFRPDVCPSLQGKPKLFFLACCLGTAYSKAVPTTLHISETQSIIQTDCEEEEEASLRSFICNDQDFFIGYSTVKGAVSFRDTRQGTWYIAELTRILSQYYQRESFQHILVLVNESVARYRHQCHNEHGQLGEHSQVPSPQHTLTKQLWF